MHLGQKGLEDQDFYLTIGVHVLTKFEEPMVSFLNTVNFCYLKKVWLMRNARLFQTNFEQVSTKEIVMDSIQALFSLRSRWGNFTDWKILQNFVRWNQREHVLSGRVPISQQVVVHSPSNL